MPGGVVHQTSATTLEKLSIRAPSFPQEEFCRAIGTYSIERHHATEPPGDVKKSLKRIGRSARVLYDQLAARSDELNDYLAQECASFGHPMLPEQLEPILLRLAGLAENASGEVEVGRGRELEARTRLIRNLALALESAGEPVTSAANDPLVQAFGLAIAEMGEEIRDPKGTVRSALKGYQGNKGPRSTDCFPSPL